MIQIFKHQIKKILLINPPQFKTSFIDLDILKNKRYFNYPPYGLGLLRKSLVEKGYDVKILDLNFELIALANTEETHNVVVCTLCSCYPRNLLGLPPDWYKQRSYRSRIVKFPRKVLKEFGLHLSDDISIRVHDSTADMRYIVLPLRPKGTEKLSVEKLEALVTRDSMIGVGLPKSI